MYNIIKVILCLLLIGFATTAMSQTVMIVNQDNPVDKATTAEVANFFLGKATQWSGGLKATPVEQKKSTKAGKAFYCPFSGFQVLSASSCLLRVPS